MGRRVLQAIAILLLGAAPLLLLEGALRLAGWPTDRVRTFGKLLTRDPAAFAAGVGMFRPNARAMVLWPPELAYTVHINSLGLRGPDIERTPPPGVVRFLALGDSMTFGFYVEEDETWPAQLQARLRATGADVQVVNGGVGGWSIDSETEYLLERGLELEPDHVLLAFFANDLHDLIHNPDVYGKAKAAIGSLRGRYSAFVHSTASYELYLRFQVRWKEFLRRDKPRIAKRAPAPSPDELERAWEIWASWLDRIQAATRERGIALTVVYIPPFEDLEDERERPAQEVRVRALTAERGLPFVSGVDAFRADPVPELYHMPQDGHLAAEGARRMGRVLAEALTPQLARGSDHRASGP